MADDRIGGRKADEGVDQERQARVFQTPQQVVAERVDHVPVVRDRSGLARPSREREADEGEERHHEDDQDRPDVGVTQGIPDAPRAEAGASSGDARESGPDGQRARRHGRRRRHSTSAPRE